MSTLLPSLGIGLVSGLALAAPPGPVNAVIAEESVVRRWTAGARAGLGAMGADAFFFVLATLNLVVFVGQFPTVQAIVVSAGGVLILYFACGVAQEVNITSHGAIDPGEDGAGFTKVLAPTLTNPYQILFWFAIGVGLLKTGTIDMFAHAPYPGVSLVNLLVVKTGGPALIFGFFDGTTVRVTGFPVALVTVERRVDSFASIVAAVSTVVLGGFGVVFIQDTVRSLVL